MNASQPAQLPGTAFPGYEVVPEGARAGLIIVHGIAEHGGRYHHAADALAANAIACFVYDQRGHGQSSGPRAHVDDFSCFAQDLQQVGQAIRRRFPALPLFVWGHSMGSVVVLRAAVEGLSWARGVITTGCAIDAMPKLDGAAGAILRLASALLPRLKISLRIDATVLTQVEAEQRAHMSDPLVPRSASLRLLYGFALACKRGREQASLITLPWLAVHGEADKVCPPSGSTSLIAVLGSSDKELVTYPALLHEVHNENLPARAAVFGLMTHWILNRV
ncbi:MAG TPA: alpha/beta hydrolase [Steroidobacteraceae bacterium]